MIRKVGRKRVALGPNTTPPASDDGMVVDSSDAATPPLAVRQSGKKGKKFSTKDAMLSIIDQVSQAEESRLATKIQRQNTIKKLVKDKESRTEAKKTKKNSRLEEIKKQLRQGHTLGAQPTKPNSKVQKKQKKRLPRTLSSVNREWNAANTAADDIVGGADNADKKSKRVSFAV